VSACVKPLGHTGRCRNDHGSTWENNHPTCERCAKLEAIVDQVMVERDRANRELRVLRDALAVVSSLAREVDECQLELFEVPA
jgi:hypothetical protein